jgi:hypothetical protein
MEVTCSSEKARAGTVAYSTQLPFHLLRPFLYDLVAFESAQPEMASGCNYATDVAELA